MARVKHSATLLRDGEFCHWRFDRNGPEGRSTGRIYDPAKGHYRDCNMSMARSTCEQLCIAKWQVMIAGGGERAEVLTRRLTPQHSSAVWMQRVLCHATLLQDGKVLMWRYRRGTLSTAGAWIFNHEYETRTRRCGERHN